VAPLDGGTRSGCLNGVGAITVYLADDSKEIRKRHPGTGVVILSKFDDPDYAVSLLSEGSGCGVGETERLDLTEMMSDIRGYGSIAEHADPTVLAQQLDRHRAEMNRAILGVGGTVMQYVGDAVMAVFGAPVPSADHAERALAAAGAMHCAQDAVNIEWKAEGRAPFGLGIGISTGPVAAALLGSEERVEYTVVGDAVNLCQRLQQFAEPGQTVLSETTWKSLGVRPDGAERLEPQLVKGRETPVVAYRIGPRHEGAT
jgi:adenylate cyclase